MLTDRKEIAELVNRFYNIYSSIVWNTDTCGSISYGSGKLGVGIKVRAATQEQLDKLPDVFEGHVVNKIISIDPIVTC